MISQGVTGRIRQASFEAEIMKDIDYLSGLEGVLHIEKRGFDYRV
jgi:hypothetical protein